MVKSIFLGVNGLWVERKVNFLFVIILLRDSKWFLEYCCVDFSFKMGFMVNIRFSRILLFRFWFSFIFRILGKYL